MTTVSLTFITRRARYEVKNPNHEATALTYQGLVALRKADMPGELSFTGRIATRNLVTSSTARKMHTVKLERNLATRLYVFAKNVLQDQRGGFSHLTVVEVATGDSRVHDHATPLPGELILSQNVTTGMPCALMNPDMTIAVGFMGLGNGLGFTYFPRSLGPAVFPIDSFQRFYAARLMHIRKP